MASGRASTVIWAPSARPLAVLTLRPSFHQRRAVEARTKTRPTRTPVMELPMRENQPVLVVSVKRSFDMGMKV